MSNNENNFEELNPNNVSKQDDLANPKSEKSLEDLLKQISALQEEVEKHKENYLRSIADFDNYRRRIAREIEEIRKNAAFSIIEDLLPVLDNLSLGVEAAKKEGNSITLEGFQLVLDQFKAVLIDNGLQEINPQSAPFDHNDHQCVSMVPSSEVEENRIISVVRLGYRLNNRLIRPASVIVSSGKPNNSEVQEL